MCVQTQHRFEVGYPVGYLETSKLGYPTFGMSLTELTIKAAEGKDKPYKVYDERGLFLLVTPTGARLWRFKYKHDGVEKLISLGIYPDVKLKDARDKRDEARRLIAANVDPSAIRRANKSARADTFGAVAEEWLETKKATLSAGTWKRDRDQLVKLVGPYLANRPIAGIEAPDLLAILKRLEKRGVRDTAHRVRAVCGRVFRYAIWHRHVSPHEVLWHAISGNGVGSDATYDHRALIALTNASCSFRGHELIASVAANDRNLATTEPFTHRVIGGDATYLIAIDKIVSFISLGSRQMVLFDQLLDLRVARFFVGLFLLSAAQLLIVGCFGELRLLRSEFRLGRHGALVLR